MKSNLILLHGALGSQDQLLPLEQSLEDTFQVHRFNFSGHGGNNIESPYSISLFAEDLKDYIQMNDLEGVHLFGYSMGGYVAMYFTAQQPDKVKSMITLGTKFEWSPEIAEGEISMLQAEKIAEKVPDFAAHLKAMHEPADWKEVVSNTADMMAELGAYGGIEESIIAAVQQPVLILRGAMDRMVSEEESYRVASQLQHGRFQVMEGFKHPIEQVDINQLAETIKNFID
jgi:pimeloyl-ACP methyl ester carboxylesterase